MRFPWARSNVEEQILARRKGPVSNRDDEELGEIALLLENARLSQTQAVRRRPSYVQVADAQQANEPISSPNAERSLDPNKMLEKVRSLPSV